MNSNQRRFLPGINPAVQAKIHQTTNQIAHGLEEEFKSQTWTSCSDICDITMSGDFTIQELAIAGLTEDGVKSILDQMNGVIGTILEHRNSVVQKTMKGLTKP